MVQPLQRTIWQFLEKLNIELSYDTAILLLDIYPKEPETSMQTNTCSQMFITTLFTTAKL